MGWVAQLYTVAKISLGDLTPYFHLISEPRKFKHGLLNLIFVVFFYHPQRQKTPQKLKNHSLSLQKTFDIEGLVRDFNFILDLGSQFEDFQGLDFDFA
jgi:hypothetical protein